MNFNELVTRIIDTTENNDEEFIARVSSFIHDSEDKLLRRIDNYWLDTTVTVTALTSESSVTFPEVRVVQHCRITTAAGRTINLIPRDEAWLREYWPIKTSVGVPKYYARQEGDVFYFVPPTNAQINIEVKGLFRPTALSSANPTNILSDRAPLALFYGAMVEANRYLKNWNTANLWNGFYEQEVNLLINDARRGRRDSTRGQSTQDVGPNNIIPSVP